MGIYWRLGVIFYHQFNLSGIILPGVTVNISFLFKSPNAGIFTESWKLVTQPLLCGGARIEIILRGVATEMDDFVEERNKLEV